MLHRQFFVYFSVIPLIVSVSYFEILRFYHALTEIYIKMSEILIIWLSVLVSQMAPYLIFILLQKSTHSVNMVLYSQNARLCRNRAPIRLTTNNVIIDFQCSQDLLLLRIINSKQSCSAVKLLQYVIANLNLKFFYTHCIYSN